MLLLHLVQVPVREEEEEEAVRTLPDLSDWPSYPCKSINSLVIVSGKKEEVNHFIPKENFVSYIIKFVVH